LGRKKLYKNPQVTDIQRDKWLKKRVLEERAKALVIWTREKSKTKKQKCVDYLRGKTRDHHITERILRGVIYGPKYGMDYYPKKPEQKYADLMGMIRTSHLISEIRRDPRFRWFSIATEIVHENPDIRDLEYVVYDFTAERGKKVKKTPPLIEWESNRREVEDTKTHITSETVERAMLPELERRQRERDDKDTRGRNDNNSNEDDEGI
jgi:hypothetical protein